MKGTLIVFCAIGLLSGLGCNGEEAPMKTDPKAVMNPGGKEDSLPPQAQGLGDKYQAAGESSQKGMDEMSRQMNAAKAASGGK